MNTLFLLLSMASIIALVIGVIKPGLIKMKSRKQAVGITLASTVGFFVLFGITAPELEKETTPATIEVSDEPKDEPKEESKDEEVASEPETEPEQALSSGEVSDLKAELENVLEDDRSFGETYYLDDYEYDGDRLKIRLDMQQDPFPTKEELIDYAESIAVYMDGLTGDDIPIRVTMVMKIEEDYILFGHANLSDGEVKFNEEKGMRLFD